MIGPTTTSIGQACSNSLAAWLNKVLPTVPHMPGACLVQARWPEASVMAPGDSSGYAAVITVYRQGKRKREPVCGSIQKEIAVAIPNTNPVLYNVGISIGQVIQPLQLDIWSTSDVDRDQTIAMLDAALNQGWNQTLGATGTSGDGWHVQFPDDPVRDGLTLALSPLDGWYGVAELEISEPEIEDSSESIQATNYRAFYSGTARGDFYQITQTALITKPGVVITVQK